MGTARAARRGRRRRARMAAEEPAQFPGEWRCDARGSRVVEIALTGSNDGLWLRAVCVRLSERGAS